ncbi:hypothetical protein BO70DRAFT_162942 [Aspergillus heteromorphus CBS 117.55]|uniref:Uncharacterized protein n=1 Tax=Aspergillus heteromorphus CBS 117.55 TaxID=1448321 RepID=A0A317WVF6_9EURO|nr:uncharacterized protein BO70DRAFT_162942 [Aspergillus heteromorphus CBS 117.55]PWY89207.1 hypothetical protein BO70DRAFT_162942 [Aspergillus heteromorphus CBS 117.55]
METTPSVPGIYCSSLRARPIWRVLGPILAASTNMAEGRLPGCDFRFSLGNGETLSLLLLAPSTVSDTQSAIARLQSTGTWAAGKKAVALLLSEEPFSSASGKCSLDGILRLQVLMVESLPAMLPIIPVADAACLLAAVQGYISSLTDT